MLIMCIIQISVVLFFTLDDYEKKTDTVDHYKFNFSKVVWINNPPSNKNLCFSERPLIGAIIPYIAAGISVERPVYTSIPELGPMDVGRTGWILYPTYYGFVCAGI